MLWYRDFDSAIAAMVGAPSRIFRPDPQNVAIYEQLFGLYRQVHDAFGIAWHRSELANVMKDLLAIRRQIANA